MCVRACVRAYVYVSVFRECYAMNANLQIIYYNNILCVCVCYCVRGDGGKEL